MGEEGEIGLPEGTGFLVENADDFGRDENNENQSKMAEEDKFRSKERNEEKRRQYHKKEENDDDDNDDDDDDDEGNDKEVEDNLNRDAKDEDKREMAQEGRGGGGGWKKNLREKKNYHKEKRLMNEKLSRMGKVGDFSEDYLCKLRLCSDQLKLEGLTCVADFTEENLPVYCDVDMIENCEKPAIGVGSSFCAEDVEQIESKPR